MNMVEKVARALCKYREECGDVDYSQMTRRQVRTYVDLNWEDEAGVAKAAIEAMRDPNIWITVSAEKDEEGHPIPVSLISCDLPFNRVIDEALEQ